MVPVGLGVAAIVLLIITLLRLKNRKVISVHESMGKISYKPLSNVNNNEEMALNSERNGHVDTDRGMMR